MTFLEFEPGSSILYSNAGTNTVARIIEVVSGRPFDQFLDERLLAPLGMRDTTFWPNDEQVSRLAESYSADPVDGHFVRIPSSTSITRSPTARTGSPSPPAASSPPRATWPGFTA